MKWNHLEVDFEGGAEENPRNAGKNQPTILLTCDVRPRIGHMTTVVRGDALTVHTTRASQTQKVPRENKVSIRKQVLTGIIPRSEELSIGGTRSNSLKSLAAATLALT